MNKNQNLEEQDHPLKNTDQAFVQVGKNGEPVVPQTATEQLRQSENDADNQPVVYDRP